MGWVCECPEGGAAEGPTAFKFLALRGPYFYIFRHPPVIGLIWLYLLYKHWMSISGPFKHYVKTTFCLKWLEKAKCLLHSKLSIGAQQKTTARPLTSNIGSRNSPLTGRNRKQDQAPSCWWTDGQRRREDRKDINHANTFIKTNYQWGTVVSTAMK